MKGLLNLLVKSGPRDLNRLDKPKIERETQRRILGPCAAAASIVHSIKYNISISTRCYRGDCQSMWREKENIFSQEVDVVKNKNLEDVAAEHLQAEARCIDKHPALGETGEG